MLAVLFEGVVAALAKKGVGALHVNLDTLFSENRARMIQLAMAHRLPVTYDVRQFAEGGGLMSYGPNALGEIRRAAVHVDKILKGALVPPTWPSSSPRHSSSLVNLKTAKALGLAIPPSILVRADEVIE